MIFALCLYVRSSPVDLIIVERLRGQLYGCYRQIRTLVSRHPDAASIHCLGLFKCNFAKNAFLGCQVLVGILKHLLTCYS